MRVVLPAEIDEAEAFAPVNRLQNLFILLTATVVFIVSVACVLMARRITNPLARLADYAGRVGKGEYAAELEIKGRDEVSSVSSTIKTMVEQMLEVQENLVTSERLATLGHVSGSIAHQLRNPLSVIDSSAYYLKRKLKDADEKVQQHLDRIRSSVGNATIIIESLLSLTQMKEPQLEKLDLITITHNAIVTSKVTARVQVVCNFPEQKVPVSADEKHLGMVFNNLIKNAVEAVDGEGTLTVTVRTTADDQAEVSFADTGSGIAPKYLGKVFQPLFSTKASGIGFGLSIAKMVVEKHGGTIAAKSESGKGATIIIKLPLYGDKDKEA